MPNQSTTADLALRLAAKRASTLSRSVTETARGVLKFPAGLVGRKQLLERISKLEAELGHLRGVITVKVPATTRTIPASASKTPTWDRMAGMTGPAKTKFYQTHRRELDRERRNTNS